MAQLLPPLGRGYLRNCATPQLDMWTCREPRWLYGELRQWCSWLWKILNRLFGRYGNWYVLPVLFAEVASHVVEWTWQLLIGERYEWEWMLIWWGTCSLTCASGPLCYHWDPRNGHVDHWWTVDLCNYYQFHLVLPGGTGILNGAVHDGVVEKVRGGAQVVEYTVKPVMFLSSVGFQGNAALSFSSSGCMVQGVGVSCSIIPRIYCNNQIHLLPSLDGRMCTC